MRKHLPKIICLTAIFLILIRSSWRMWHREITSSNSSNRQPLPPSDVDRGKYMPHSGWHFADPPNAAVITTKRIAFKKFPVLGVIHQGGWQFLDGESVVTSDGAVVELQGLLQDDASLEVLADLPEGWQAWRKKRDAPWQRSRL